MILFHCTCGKKLKVDDSFAGKNVRCGSCGQRITVPGTGQAASAAPASAPPAADGLEGLAQAMRSSPRPSMLPNKRAVAASKPASATAASGQGTLNRLTNRKAPKESNKAFLVTLVVATVVLVAIVIVAVMIGGTEDPQPVADVTPTAPVKKAAPSPAGTASVAPTGTAAPTSTEKAAQTATEDAATTAS
jgi:hypothetical protein